MRLLADARPAGSHRPRRRRRGARRRGGEGGLHRHAQRRGRPRRRRAGLLARGRLGELAEAAYALALPEDEGGIPWIATNTDWTIPQARGIAPGNGTLVSAVHTAVGRLATVAGKPETPIFEEAVARFGARQAALHRRPPRHRHPRGRARRDPLRARAHRHRPAQAAARGSPGLAPTSSSPTCASCTSRIPRPRCARTGP